MRIITKLLLLFFVVLSYSSIHAQNTVIDSLQKLLQHTRSDTARISLYIQLSSEAEDSTAINYSETAQRLVNARLRESGGSLTKALNNYLSDAIYYKAIYFANNELYDSAILFLHAAMQPALAAGNKKQEALILNDIGVCSFYKNDVPASVDYLKKSLAIREELQDDVELRNAYNNVAFIYKETGLIQNSLELNFKALALAEKMNNEADISTSLNNIGQLYHQSLRDYPKALEYYNKSLAIREKTGNKKDLGLIKNNIASLYGNMENYSLAIRYYLEALKFRREAKYKYGVVQTLSNLAFNYIQIKDFEKASATLAESMELNKDLKDRNLLEAIHFNYAEMYDALNKTDSALFHAKISYDICNQFGNPLDISKSAQLLSALYEKKKNYKEALSLYHVYKKMQDSILNDNLKKTGIKTDIEYQYLKKKSESDKVYTQQIAKKNFYTSMLVVLLIASTVIGFVLYKRYKLKQQLKQVEIRNRIASDLHDDVGSTLSSIRMYSDIVKHQPNQTETSTQLLNKISDNSKEMIENMSDIVWMIKPGNDEFINIENRMLNFANELCVPAGINFEFNKNTSADDIKMPMEQRRDIYLIFKEAINNAVKYSGCHSINAEISFKNHHLQVRISDDGKGFDVSASKKGNGLTNMQKRTTAHKGTFNINSAPNEGTELTFTFYV